MNPGILNSLKTARMRNRMPPQSNRSAIAGVQYPREFDPDALRYIMLVEAADRQSLQPYIKEAINNLVVGLKTGGVWHSIKVACPLIGPRTISGAMVSIKGPSPTPYNFLPSHYSQTKGLTGLAAGLRTLDSNWSIASVDRNNAHIALFGGGGNAVHIGAANNEIGGWAIGTNSTNVNCRLQGTATTSTPGNVGAVMAFARKTSADIECRTAYTSRISTTSSDSFRRSLNLRVFGNITGAGVVSASTGTHKWYSAGEYLDVAVLDYCLLRYSAEIMQAPKCRHPEAQHWIYRVYQNGGTLSQQQADTVSDFCFAIDAAGLRSKMYRLNPQTGLIIQSVLVPLYLSEVPFGVTAANIVDTNVSLVSADYSPIIGTIGDGSTKYIRTIPLTSIKTDWSTHSIGIDIANAYPDTTQRGHCGVFFNESITSPRSRVWISGSSVWPNGASAISTVNSFTTAPNLKAVNRSASNNMRLYENGIQVGSTQTTSATGYTQMPACDFCVLARGYQNVSAGVPTTIVHGDAKSTGIARGYFIGDSMTPAEHTTFASIWSSMQIKLGRLSPTVSNVDAQNWIMRVYHNGGTVSSVMASAINAFCDAIDAAGLRNRFYRLNLFYGESLNGCVVPLYRGPTTGGSTYGNTIDTIVGFTSANYGPLSGLVGGGGTKYLTPGVSPTLMGLDTLGELHLAADVLHPGTVTDARLVARYGYYADGTLTRYEELHFNPSGGATAIMGGAGGTFGTTTSITSTSGNTGLHLFTYSDTDTSGFLYLNGVEVGSDLTPATGALGYSVQYHIFGRAQSTNDSTAIGGSGGLLSDARLGAYSIGRYMNAAQAEDFMEIYSTFKTSIGRI